MLIPNPEKDNRRKENWMIDPGWGAKNYSVYQCCGTMLQLVISNLESLTIMKHGFLPLKKSQYVQYIA